MHWNFAIPGEVKVTMEGFINDLIAEAGVIRNAISPAANYLFEVRDHAPKLDKQQKENFHTLVAKALYLSKRVRPDLLLTVSFLTTRVLSPDIDDLNKLNRMIRYLNESKSLGIILRATQETQIQAFMQTLKVTPAYTSPLVMVPLKPSPQNRSSIPSHQLKLNSLRFQICLAE